MRSRAAGVPPWAMVVGSVLSLQSGAVLAAGSVPALGSGGLALTRLAFAAPLLAVVVRPRWAQVRKAGVGWVALLGVVVATDNWLFYASLQWLDLGPSVTLAFLGPLVLAAATARSGRALACVATSAVGVVLLTRGLGPRPLLGAVLAVCSGAAIAAYVVVARRVSARCDDGGPMAVALAAGALALTPLLALERGAVLPARTLETGLVLAVIASAVPYALEFRAARRLRADTFALLLCLEPAVAAGLGWALLHQRLGTGQLAGVLLVVVGSAVAATLPAAERRPAGRHRRRWVTPGGEPGDVRWSGSNDVPSTGTWRSDL